MRIRFYAVCLLLLLGIRPALGQSLSVHVDNNTLKFAAKDLHFVAGEALQQLKNGASVNYVFQTALLTDRNGSTLVQITYRFAVSYDLWEEKFTVTRLEPSPRSASHLSAAGAEAWCLDSIVIPTDTLVPDRPFWAVLDYQVERRQAADAPNDPDPVTRLINIFGRRNAKPDLSGRREGGPFRLVDLRRTK